MVTVFGMPDINLKRALVLLCLFMCLLPLYAVAYVTGPDSLQSESVFLFKEKVLFRHASSSLDRDFGGNKDRLDSIRMFLTDTCGRNILNISVIGSYSPEGTLAFNTALGLARAKTLADWLKNFNIPSCPATSVVSPDPSVKDFVRQRFAEVRVSWRPCPAVTITPDLPVVRQDEAVQEEHYLREEGAAGSYADVIDDVVQESGADVSAPSRKRSFADNIVLSTNLLYDAMLTPNIGAGISVSDRVILLADWMYARWNNHDRRLYWRIYGGDVEVRYRIGARREGSPLGGHYIGAYGSMACYDFQAGRSHTGVLSDFWNYAAGVSYTYSLPVSTHFNIDFNLGIGYLWGRYKKHTPIDDCDVWLSTHRLGWFGPTRAGVSLVWLIGNRVKNSRKGGAQ